MATWTSEDFIEDEEVEGMGEALRGVTDNETVRFGAVILKYIAQRLKESGGLIMGGGWGAWKGILGGLALLLFICLFVTMCIAVFRGDVDYNLHGINIPQVVAVIAVVLTFVAAALPVNAIQVTEEFETEVVREGEIE